MEVELHLLVFGGNIKQTVGNAFVNLSEVLDFVVLLQFLGLVHKYLKDNTWILRI